LAEIKEWLSAHPDDGPRAVLESLQGIQTNQWNLSALLLHGLVEADTVSSRQGVLSLLQNADSFPPPVAIQAVAASGDLGAKADPGLKQTLTRLMDSSISDGVFQISDTALFAFARIAREDAASQTLLLERIARDAGSQCQC
jgi:hypothetical protein